MFYTYYWEGKFTDSVPDISRFRVLYLSPDLSMRTPVVVHLLVVLRQPKFEAVFDAVLPLLNACARIPVSGLISQYNAPSLLDRMNLLLGTILRKRMTMRGFIVFNDFGHLYPEFARQMGDWIKENKVHYREEMIEGLERAPSAFA